MLLGCWSSWPDDCCTPMCILTGLLATDIGMQVASASSLTGFVVRCHKSLQLCLRLRLVEPPWPHLMRG